MSPSRALLLGSGFVAKPTLDILAQSGIQVTVEKKMACRTLKAAQELCEGVKNATPMSLDVFNTSVLDVEVAKNDLVISLIPYIHHVQVIKSAIRSKKHVVTTSYVSPAMKELDQEASRLGNHVLYLQANTCIISLFTNS